MSFAIRIGAGPLKNSVFHLKEGLTIGRHDADIVLNDPKVSSLHATITRSADGHWMVADNGSKNGLRLGQERVKSLPLKEGVVFYVGDFPLQVLRLEAVLTPAPTATKRAPEKPKKLKSRRYWHEILSEFIAKNSSGMSDRPRTLQPLNPALILEFVRGVQMNSRWTLGFGPRQVGAACVDLPIWEPGAPPTCFEILPSNQGLLFKTAHPDMVRLNDRPVTSQVLRVGDTIRIADTMIEVDFLE